MHEFRFTEKTTETWLVFLRSEMILFMIRVRLGLGLKALFCAIKQRLSLAYVRFEITVWSPFKFTAL
jgi:hypothetical protein